MLADELLESVRHAVRGAGADGPAAAIGPELVRVEVEIGISWSEDVAVDAPLPGPSRAD